MNPIMIGRSVERREADRFTTGAGCYVDDVKRPGMTHAVVVRSAIAHARIRGIDAESALALPGVLAVLTFADIEAYAKTIPQRVCPLPGMEKFLQMPLARDEVLYVGEPIALVIAENRYVAEDAAELVMVDYDMLDAVVDMREAMTGKVILHKAQGSNIASHYEVGRGDCAAAFRKAHYTRKEKFRIHRHSSVPLETRGLVAEWDAESQRMQVWGAAKVLFANRAILADMLRLDAEAIDMIEVDVGGSFGVRGDFYPEDFLIPYAAKFLGRPVKWIEDRRENLMATNHSREMECELEIAVDADGIIQAMRGHVLADMGAYIRTNAGVMAGKGTQFMQGPYVVPHLGFEVHAVMTNKTPVGTYRGPGRYEATFFRERLLDIAASEMGIDPVLFRKKNLVRADQMPYDAGALVPGMGSTIYDSGDYPAVFARALAEFGYEEKKACNGKLIDGRLHGVGLGCFVESTGGGPGEHARLELRRGGKLDVFVGSSCAGQGHETVMAQVLADALDVPFDSIQVFHGSTSYLKNGYGAYHSRSAVMGGSAVMAVATAMRARLLEHVAREHGVGVEELVYREGSIVRAADQAELATLASISQTLPVVAAESRGEFSVDASFENDKLTFTFGVQLAHVAVDPQTAQVDVLAYLCVEDIGRILNPAIVHGQTVGAAMQGMGGTFLDEFVYDENGQLITGSFADYLLPTSTDFPNIDALTLDTGLSPSNPLGAKGAGEGGIVATGATLANAVSNALGPLSVSITTLPMSLNNLAAVIRQARLAQ